ncbi:MAG: hypothetical protein ACJ71A_08385 [Nitrososphaeraceae archaeon]
MEYFKTDSKYRQHHDQKHKPEEVEDDAPKNNILRISLMAVTSL